jgi:hypothetical protein
MKINLGGTPTSPEQAAAAWDNSILNFYSCGPTFIITGTVTPTYASEERT